ncbi:D-tyrosyl-tRNA(Tyr) deacylase [Cryptotrichosporon argae]
MRAVIQRVVNASVAVDGQTISSIGRGLLVLVGIERHDTPADAAHIIKKILAAKLWAEAEAPWKRSVRDIDGEVLCVSQFTLFANFKGTKPDFHESMSTVPGKAFYTAFLDEIRAAYRPDRIQDGQFGAMMQVSLTNDGPVTILLDSRDKVLSASASGTSTAKPSAPAPPLAPGDTALTEDERRAKAEAKKAKRDEQRGKAAAGREARGVEPRSRARPAPAPGDEGMASAAAVTDAVTPALAALSLGALPPLSAAQAAVPAPRPFSGARGESLASFLASCDGAFAAHAAAFPDDASRCAYAAHQLDGAARSVMAVMFARKDRPPVVRDYGEFKAFLQQSYGWTDRT